MEILKSLGEYTIAQKLVGTSLMVIGILLIVFAIINNYAFSQTELVKGLKFGSLICGIFILIGGFGYNNFNAKTELKQIEIHNQSKDNFLKQENIRMKKVIKDYLVYQIVFGSFIIISILIIWFAKNPFWHGIAFSIIILFTSVMIIEANSHKSIMSYKTQVEKE
jgi:hypothetical protein